MKIFENRIALPHPLPSLPLLYSLERPICGPICHEGSPGMNIFCQKTGTWSLLLSRDFPAKLWPMPDVIQNGSNDWLDLMAPMID